MLRLKTLTSMSPEERANALGQLSTERNGVQIDAEIRALEQRYEMSSDTMRARLKRGEMDNADTARWSVLLAARAR